LFVLVLTSPAFVNPLKERELDLRGNKIPKIENLGATEDQYDVIDFSDNDITRLENFPLLPRITTILLNNNRVQSIEEGLHGRIPNLETLVLTNNRIENLSDVDQLAGLKKLHTLSLFKNPITKQKHYRLYVIHKLPSLSILDFNKVKAKERLEAATLFGGDTGKLLEAELAKKKTFIPGAAAASGLSEEQKQKIKDLMTKSTSMEEVQRLERALASGKLPKELHAAIAGVGGGAGDAMTVDNGVEDDGVAEGVVGQEQTTTKDTSD